jgi:hypothetical protein
MMEQLLASITRRVSGVLGSVTELGAAMTAVAAEAGPRPLRRVDLAELRPLVAGVLGRHEGLIAGTGVVLAPGVLADAPRWIEWWWADEGGGISQLDVDLDPRSAEFYDYTTTEWYREPARAGKLWVAGPYVDYICTHKYTFTLSAPVLHAGRFLGVAGADILADRVERLVLPGLARLGRPAVLASGHGRVIASNTASAPPGVVLGRQRACARFRRIAGPGETDNEHDRAALPWVLLAAPVLDESLDYG